MTGCVFYESDRAKVLVLEPIPALLVMVRADADRAAIAGQLRKLADELDQAGPVVLPALHSDEGPPMTCFVAEVDGSAEQRLSTEQAD